MKRAALVIALAVALACLAVALACLAGPARASGPVTAIVWLSTFTYWNNSPPGYGIEYARGYGYPAAHDWACCRAGGTYADPITFAAQKGFLSPGTRVYIPWLRRYFILEDLCSSCTAGPQMDLWLGGVSAAQERDQSPRNIVNLWQRRQVIVSPPVGLPVSLVPFRLVRISAHEGR